MGSKYIALLVLRVTLIQYIAFLEEKKKKKGEISFAYKKDISK